MSFRGRAVCVSPASNLLRILIVEDYQDSAESLALVQRHFGHDVRIARDGWQAAEAVRAWTPDVVFLDIGLPGMDGWKVAGRLWPAGSANRPLVVAISGYGMDEDRRRSAEAGI